MSFVNVTPGDVEGPAPSAVEGSVCAQADEAVTTIKAPRPAAILAIMFVSSWLITAYRAVCVAPLKTDSIAAAAHFSPSALDTPIAPIT